MTKSILIILLAFIFGKDSNSTINQPDKEILIETLTKLNSIKTVEYNVVSDFNQKTFNQYRVDSAICFFDFASDNMLGTRYHFKTSKGEQIYNGQKEINVDYNEGKVVYKENPSKESASSSIFMRNSIFELKEVLPELISKSNVHISRQKDTLINGEWNYKFRLLINGGEIFYGKVKKSEKANPVYALAISKETYLPTYFCSYFPQNTGQHSSTFSNFNFSAERFDDTWNYDQYKKEYVVLSAAEQRENRRSTGQVNVGDIAPNWKLPLVDSQDSVRITDLKGNLVLIEFFFPGCAYCLQAVPDINTLYNLYKDKGLKVYGIEFSKSNNKGLVEYLEKYKYMHPVLHTGGEVAKRFGVTGAPTYFLIDKKGKVAYKSVGFKSINEIARAIEENM